MGEKHIERRCLVYAERHTLKEEGCRAVEVHLAPHGLLHVLLELGERLRVAHDEAFVYRMLHLVDEVVVSHQRHLVYESLVAHILVLCLCRGYSLALIGQYLTSGSHGCVVQGRDILRPQLLLEDDLLVAPSAYTSAVESHDITVIPTNLQLVGYLLYSVCRASGGENHPHAALLCCHESSLYLRCDLLGIVCQSAVEVENYCLVHILLSLLIPVL